MKHILFTFAKEFEADIKNIPARIERRESRKAAVFLVAFGIVFAGFPLGTLVWTLMTGRFVPMILSVAIPFPLIGFAVLIYGINLGVKRTVIDIGHDEVRVNHVTLFKKISWTEPRMHYRGVLLAQRARGDRYYHTVTLNHDREDRRVELAVYMAGLVPEPYVRGKWEEYSRRLDLPAMRESAGGVTERPPEHLDTPLRDLPADGTADTTVPAPPAGIAVVSSGGHEELLVTAKRTLRPRLAVPLLISAFMMWIGFYSREDPSLNFIVAGAAGALLGAWVVIYTLFDLITTQSLRFVQDRIILARKIFGGYVCAKSLYAGEVRGVRIDKGTVHKVDAVIIETAEKTLQAGHDLPPETLRWMSDFIEQKIRAT